MGNLAWRAARVLSRAALALHYRSFRVAGADRIPAAGPALLVVNHPNSILDGAAVLAACPRPVRFAAASELFAMPVLGAVLRALGCVPIERPRGGDARGEGSLRRNFDAFPELERRLREGEVVAIFPEGATHLEPRLLPVKSGPARIALGAEEASGFSLGLAVVPVGLQYEPRQAFRGEAHVRVGPPFGVADLAGTPRHAAIRAVQERIAAALRPLVLHIGHAAMEPFVRRVAEIYDQHQREARRDVEPIPPADLVRIAGACLDHFLAADPEAVERVRREVRRHDRLAEALHLTPETVERRGRPVRAALGMLGIALEAAIGLPVFAAGTLVGRIPFRATDAVARRFASGRFAPALPVARILVGLGVVGVPWAVVAWSAWDWSRSPGFTACAVAATAASALYAMRYRARLPAWRDRFVSLRAVAFRRSALRHAAEARARLVDLVRDLARRFESETHAGIVPPRTPTLGRRILAALPGRRIGAVAAVAAAVWLAFSLRDRGGDAELPPSPWATLGEEAGAARLAADAAAAAGAMETLETLRVAADALRADLAAGRRDWYDPAVGAETGRAMVTYLACRDALLHAAWTYHDAATTGPPALRERADLLAHASLVELARRGHEFLETYEQEPRARARIEAGDPAWGVPPGLLSRVRSNLADGRVVDALAAGQRRFDALRASGRLPSGAPYDRIVACAADGGRVRESVAGSLWKRKWRQAVAEARETAGGGVYAASSWVSTWVGDTRIRDRPHDRGLVTPEQLAAFRAKLRPGDILLERRNWFLSNAFLPGYWPHSALWIGGEEGVRDLGIDGLPEIADDVAALRVPDAHGRLPAVLEAISEGVVLTSPEESIGGADSVCALRPRLPREEIAAAVRRALTHRGKPYDFDFDFFSVDRLVCTEVVYQAYQGSLRFDLVEIAGRRTLPAIEIVRAWDRTRAEGRPALDLVAFLDGDESAGTAREASEDEFRATLGRPGLTWLQPAGAGGGVPAPLAAVLLGLAGVGLFVLRRD